MSEEKKLPNLNDQLIALVHKYIPEAGGSKEGKSVDELYDDCVFLLRATELVKKEAHELLMGLAGSFSQSSRLTELEGKLDAVNKSIASTNAKIESFSKEMKLQFEAAANDLEDLLKVKK